jgi:YD repeat-containing protein
MHGSSKRRCGRASAGTGIRVDRLLLFLLVSVVFILDWRSPSSAGQWSYYVTSGSAHTPGDDAGLGEDWARESLAAQNNWVVANAATCEAAWQHGALSYASCGLLADLTCTTPGGSWPCGHAAFLECDSNEINTAGGCEAGPPPFCSPTAGDPVNIGTGETIETVTDYSTSGQMPLEFVRTYRSNYHILFSDSDGTSGPQVQTVYSRFGRAWRSNFDSVIGFQYGLNFASPGNGALVNVITPQGAEIVFMYSTALAKWQPAYISSISSGLVTWAVRTDLNVSLVVSANILVKYQNNDVLAYNTNGQLIQVRKPGGYIQTLTYDSQGRNTIITDSFGRSLSFTYNSDGYVDTMTTPGGTYRYAYAQLSHAPAGLEHHELGIGKVYFPDATPSNPNDNPFVTYHYEDPDHRSALTGITDERGIRYATWAYDSKWRVTRSTHALGDDNTTFSYDDPNNTRTVTNPLTKNTIYHFQNFQGHRVLSQVEGIASSHCATSDTLYARDANGFVNQTTDGEGRITKFTNNSRGLPTVITEAFGTPEQRTTNVTWDPSFSRPTQIAAPRLTTDLTWDTPGNLHILTQTDTTTHTVPYSTNGQTRIWTFGYSPAGLLLTADGPLSGTGDTVTYSYDTSGFVDTITDEVGLVTQVTAKNGNGQPLTIVDPNSVTTTMTYDERGRLKTVTVNPGASQLVTSFDYYLDGDIKRITRPDGSYLDYTYDDARRVTLVTNNFSEKIELGYNAMGEVTSRTIKTSGGTIALTQTQVFDELGRLLQSIGASAQTTTFSYDKATA